MPVSREQFTAAAQKVASSAPPGLSREDFDALIDKELSQSAPIKQKSYLEDVGDTAKGYVGGLASAVNPINIAKGVYGAVETATNPAKLMEAGRGIKRFAGDVASGDVWNKTPGEVGDMLGQVVGSAALPKLVPPVVKGLKRLGAASAGGAELAMAGAKGAATNMPFVSQPIRGAISGVKGALKDRARAAEAEASRIPMAEGLDRFMPNTSAAPIAEPPVGAPTPRSMPGPTGSGVRSFMESELQGQNALGQYWDDMYGAGEMPPRVTHPGQGLESYVGTAAEQAPQQRLMAELAKQPEVTTDVPRLDLKHMGEQDLGRELGRLLEKLSSGRGGLPARR